jgi:hypothetical protein
MKSSRRRSDGTKRNPPSDPRRPATPTMDGPRADMPSEFIDLSTDAFRAAFPDLDQSAAGSRPSQRSRSPAPRRGVKDKG